MSETIPLYSGPANYYGGIVIKRDDDGATWWAIQNYNGLTWKPCPAGLYVSLLSFQVRHPIADLECGCIARHEPGCCNDDFGEGTESPVTADWKLEL